MKKLEITKLNHVPLQKYLLAIPIFIAIFSIILKPNIYINSAYEGLIIFAKNVLPSLFPFFFFTKLLTSIGMANSISNLFKKPVSKLFNTPPISSYVFIMSLISGYPVGAKILCDLYNQHIISSNDVKRIMPFTSLSGPLFIIGTIGTGLMNSTKIGYIILVSNILGALLNGIIFRFFNKNEIKNNESIINMPMNVDNILEDTINTSVMSILVVGGYIVIFYILADVFYNIGLLKLIAKIISLPFGNFEPNIFSGISLSLVEMTKGIVVLSNVNSNIKVPIISGIIAFGGLSITLQSLTYLSRAKIKISYYFATKLIQGMLAFLIAYILTMII